MKNIIELVKSHDIHDLLESQWKSETFKNKTYKNKWIDEVLIDFCKTPKIICNFNDDEEDRLFFYSWFHILAIGASYTVPLFHDLRILHEAIHMRFRQKGYATAANQEAWAMQILHEEFAASIMSEQMVYFDDEETRNEVDMPKSIFYDQFKKREKYFLAECMRHDDAFALLSHEITQFKTLLANKTIKPSNYFEERSYRYALDSSYWTIQFQDVYQEVENMMQKACHSGEDKTKIVLDYVMSVSDNGIPFYDRHQSFTQHVNREEKYEFKSP